jgi:hypothetical protein
MFKLAFVASALGNVRSFVPSPATLPLGAASHSIID